MQDVDFVKGFSFTTGSGIVYFAKLNGDDQVDVTWFDGDPRWFWYTMEDAVMFLQNGTWQVVHTGDIQPVNGYVYQVGFADGTWRDISEVTFNEAKSWPCTHATRIIQVI